MKQSEVIAWISIVFFLSATIVGGVTLYFVSPMLVGLWCTMWLYLLSVSAAKKSEEQENHEE